MKTAQPSMSFEWLCILLCYRSFIAIHFGLWFQFLSLNTRLVKNKGSKILCLWNLLFFSSYFSFNIFVKNGIIKCSVSKIIKLNVEGMKNESKYQNRWKRKGNQVWFHSSTQKTDSGLSLNLILAWSTEPVLG